MHGGGLAGGARHPGQFAPRRFLNSLAGAPHAWWGDPKAASAGQDGQGQRQDQDQQEEGEVGARATLLLRWCPCWRHKLTHSALWWRQYVLAAVLRSGGYSRKELEAKDKEELYKLRVAALKRMVRSGHSICEPALPPQRTEFET